MKSKINYMSNNTVTLLFALAISKQILRLQLANLVTMHPYQLDQMNY